ncbi:MAG TPA: Ig-like domain-containing protein [bacterium]|nr:Ig-like domain-containing protein [bacterium]
MRPLRSLVLTCALLVASSAASAQGAEPARISLVQAAQTDGAVRLVATVTDRAGAPASGAAVTFLGRTAFGWLTLAEVDTDAAGTASITLSAPPRYPEVRARLGEDASVQAGLRLGAPAVRNPQRRPGREALRDLSPQPGFLSPYPPAQILFVAVLLGGIWTTYAYLIALLLRLRRAS